MPKDPDLQIPIGLLNDLYEARSRRELLEVYAKWSRVVFDADRCNVALQVDENHLLVTTMTKDKTVSSGQKYRIADSLLGAVFSRQTAMHIDDLSANPHPGCRALVEAGLGSLMIAPLVIRGRCYGTIAIGLLQGRKATDSEYRLIQAIGRCLASQLTVIERMEGLTNALTTDTLTKAGNRRHYTAVIDRLWGAWQTELVPYSLLLIDIDNFKTINDTYGHGIGDQVLCGFVNRLRANVRKGDKVMRIGGEEFAITFGGETISDGMIVAERLHRTIREEPFSAGNGQLTVTACFGLTEVGASDEAHGDVFDRADKSLYRAKKTGRDKIVVTAPPAPAYATAS